MVKSWTQKPVCVHGSKGHKMARISGRPCQALRAIYMYSCQSKAAFQFGSLPGVKYPPHQKHKNKAKSP